jgi:hypothetical protein
MGHLREWPQMWTPGCVLDMIKRNALGLYSPHQTIFASSTASFLPTLKSHDVIIQAQTGTDTISAFSIPILQN